MNQENRQVHRKISVSGMKKWKDTIYTSIANNPDGMTFYQLLILWKDDGVSINMLRQILSELVNEQRITENDNIYRVVE
ncbi:MAG: hypothetical protein ACFFD4_28000 [Candidatus Odinarchaeota archaeon]